jgi:hypothetical protein
MLYVRTALASPWVNNSAAGAASRGERRLQRLASVRSDMTAAGANKFADSVPPPKEIHAFQANKDIGTCNN